MWWAQLLNNVVALFDSGAGGGGGSFESIATATGTGSSNTITFSSIPSTYVALQIRYIAKNTYNDTGSDWIQLTTNGLSSGYAYHYIYGNGSVVSANGGASQSVIYQGNMTEGATGINNMMGAGIIDIADYSSSTKNKTIRTFSGFDTNTSGSAQGYVYLWSGLTTSTSAITSISLSTPWGNFSTNTQFALYGTKGA